MCWGGGGGGGKRRMGNTKLVPCFLLFCYVPFFFSLFITVNPRYNDSICSKRRCHLSEFAVVRNT